ncbi:exodeoxyribonuclease VII small subunit [Candidatus Poribacteria bacterium]|nr:exodeoxyribonuclease VII small subunit [Candidatus Poribacteria bacterium]
MIQQKNKNFQFEDGLKRLEEIVEKLESGNLSLDDSLKYFEEGVVLSRVCTQKLNEVERKIEILTKNENGNLSVKPFIEKNEEKETRNITNAEEDEKVNKESDNGPELLF